MKISTVIITLNEAKTIGECVTQASRVSDEVIVVDAESTDDTRAIAQNKGATVFTREWEGYGKAKNFGNSKAKNDWILSLDADEILSDTFIDSFTGDNLDIHTIYRIDIQTIYNGKPIRHSGFYPTWKPRLFHRKMANWNASDVHESLEFPKSMKTERIKGKVFHYSITSRESYERKLDQYAFLGAKSMIDANKKPGMLKQWLGPVFRFFKVYVLELGVLDGRIGFQLAVMFMKANRAKWLYYKELQPKN